MTDLTNGAADAAVADDLHADLAAAFDTPADAGATADAGQPDAGTQPAPQDGPARDEQGRFTPKPADAT
ncbi:hypothetical protein, partial [Inquilinus limosus]